MADFPSSIKTFATLADQADSVLAAHQNERGAEISAIETELGTDPAGSYSTVAERLAGVDTGWTEVSDTWTYASASTITVPSDATATYQKWMRVRFKQGGSYKYFVVKSLTSTVLTVVTNTDYTVANAAITDIAYSFLDKPYGFPDEFNFAPSWTNLTVGSGTVTAKLKASAYGVIKGHVEIVFNSTTIGGSVSISLPVPRGTYGGTPRFLSGNAVLIDAGTASYQGVTFVESSIEVYVSNAASTYVGRTPLSSTVPHTWANTDEMSFNFEYYG